MSALVVEIISNPSATLITLTGAADVSGSPELERKLTMVSAQRPKVAILDLSGLTFISSLCMGSLIQFGHGLTKRGSRVAVAAAQPMVADALRRIRMESVLPMYPTVEDALATQPQGTTT